MTALGVLHPGHSAEDDYPRIEQLLGSDIRVDLVRMDSDAREEDAVDRLGPADRLAKIGEQLRLAGAEAVVWASTSGSFAYGWEGAQRQIGTLARAAGMPASSTSFAFVHAMRELNVRQVAIASPYGPEETAAFAGFLRAAGVEPVATRAADTPPDDERSLLALARAADHPQAQAVLIPGTSLHTAAHLQSLETTLAKPVLTATQTTIWEALRLTDRRVNAPGLGALFTREPIVQV